MPYARPGAYVSEVLNPSVSPLQPGATVASFVGAHFMGPTMTYNSQLTGQPTLVTSWGQFVQQFGGFFPAVIPTGFVTSYLPFAVFQFFNNGGAACFVTRLVGAGATKASLQLRDRAGTPANALLVTAISEGQWANSLYIEIINRDPTGASGRVTFDLNVYLGGTTTAQIVERWTDISMVTTDQRYAPTVINAVNGSPGSVYITVADNDPGTTASPQNIPALLSPTALTTGADGAAPSTANKTFAVTSPCPMDFVPGPMILSFPGETTNSVLTQAVAYADPASGGRGDTFVVADIPNVAGGVTTSAQAVTNAASLTASSYVGVYWPWLQCLDPSSVQINATRLLPPSGAVCGIMARTDNAVGPFKTPAGVQAKVTGALTQQVMLANSDLDALNNGQVNAIKLVPTVGLCVFGGRTLKPAGADRYIAVRRTLNYLKTVFISGTQWAVFQPNDQRLWSTLTATISQFLTAFWQQGGLRGISADQAFFVVCNSTNNTPQTIAAGEVHIDIGLAVQYPAEFLVFKIGQWEGGNSVTEAQ